MTGASCLRALAALEPFEPRADRVQLVTLPLHDERGVLVDATGTTLVVRWPTDSRGRVDAAAVREGRIDVLAWTLTPGAERALARLAIDWPPAAHDVFVEGTPDAPVLGPSLRTLRTLTVPLGIDLDARVASARRLLAA